MVDFPGSIFLVFFDSARLAAVVGVTEICGASAVEIGMTTWPVPNLGE